jgi:hypothetical protein
MWSITNQVAAVVSMHPYPRGHVAESITRVLADPPIVRCLLLRRCRIAPSQMASAAIFSRRRSAESYDLVVHQAPLVRTTVNDLAGA